MTEIMRFSRTCRQKKIAPHLMLTLLVIRDNPKASMTSIADFFGCSPAAVTGRMEMLEKLRMIRRKHCDHDRRAYEAIMTDLGILTVSGLKIGKLSEDREEDDSDGFRA